MRHITMMRARILKNVERMLDELRIQISCWMPDETQSMYILEKPQQAEMITAVTHLMMIRLGAPEANPKEERFDKTKRTYNKSQSKLRGSNTFNNGKQRKRAKVEALASFAPVEPSNEETQGEINAA